MRKGSFGLVTLMSALALLAPAQASQGPAVRKDCILLAHAGSQDKPVGSVRMCPGKKAKRDFHSSLENKWGFQFDPDSFARLREIVVHQKHESTPAGILPPGTFSASWREQGKVADDDYTLEPAQSCAFLDELASAVPAQEYAEFVHVVADLQARVHCPAPAAK